MDRSWVYQLLATDMEDAGLEEVDTYVSHHHKTVTQFIVIRRIMDLRISAEQGPGSRVSHRWWEQEILDLEEI